MSDPLIAMFNLNETKRDPRVRRMAHSLASRGYRVIVLGIKQESDVSRERADNFEILRIDRPGSRSAKDLKSLEDICPSAAEIVRKCNRSVLDYNIDSSRLFLKRALRKLGRIANSTPLGPLMPGGKDRKPSPSSPELEIHDIRYILLVNMALYRAAEKLSPQIIHCNDLDTLLCGSIFKINHNLPLVYDAHEIYNEQLPEALRSIIGCEFYGALEKSLTPFTDRRITVCNAISSYFKEKYGAGEFEVIRSVPSLRFLPDPAILKRRNNPRRILYHGAYSVHRGLEEVIESAKWIENGQIIFRGIGAQESALRKLAGARGLEDRISFAPPVTVDELIRSASECDIGLSPFIPSCRNTELVLPNKFFEYMMAGLALASTDLIEMRSLTEAHDAGVLFDSTKPEHIADALNKLIADPDRLDHCRRNAYEAARTAYNWEAEEKKLFALYEGLI